MTKKVAGVKPLMELDIESFLDSDSDSGSDSPSVSHRTVDEILNASDSSSASSSPPSSPPSVRDHLRRQKQEDVSRSESETRLKDAVRPESVESLKSGGVSRVSGGIRKISSSSSSFTSSYPRQSPSLFSGMRSNAKPGAALAAAAAASRLVRAPHAAIIKSRRASSASSGMLQKVLDARVSNAGEEDQDVSSSNEDSAGAGAGSNVSADGFRSSDGEFPRVDGENGVGTADEEKEAELKEVRGSVVAEVVTDTHNSAANSKSESVDTSTPRGYDIEDCFTVKQDSTPLEAESIIADSIEGENMVVASLEEVSESLGLDDSDKKNILSSPANDKMATGEDNSTRELKRDNSGTVMPISNNKEVYASAPDHDDGNSLSDISEIVEERIKELEKERMNKREENKLRSFRKPLDLAEEFEKKQAYTGLHWEEGAAAQPMRLEGVKTGSTTLGYFSVDADNFVSRTISSQAFKRDHGSPQVLAVHVNFIAVGMSKGVIIVVPTKYSSHSADQMDPKMIWLGLQGERSQAVTSICFNQQGDLLLAGYVDGHVTVWDVQRASAAKVITGEHTAPVVHTLFLGRDSQGSRQFKAITSDTKGLVFLHTFSGVLLLNMYSVKTQCLLDGQRNGTVLSASPLLDESCGSSLPSSQGNTTASSSSLASMMGGVVGVESGWKLFNEGSSLVEEGVVIFVTYQTALVVRLIPNLEVYAQLARPDGVREGSMPYTAWKCMMQCHGSSAENLSKEAADRVSLLAIAWDRKVQVATLVKSQLKGYAKWSLDSVAIGVAWLDDQMLVIPTMTGCLYLFAKDGTMIHQTTFSVDMSTGDDLVSYHTYFTNVFGNPEKAYHNSVGVRGASIYILGTMHLVVSRLLPWKERINVLRKAGDWMGALNMAITLYDGDAHGVVDLPKSVEAAREAIAPSLAELLLSYVDEVFSYISVAFLNQIEKPGETHESSSGSHSVHSEINEQYNRVGGVAVEFCAHTKRMDLLFDEIFSKFVAVQQRDTFLELLEPYILKDMLGSLPPEIMQALVEHYSSKGWLHRVEQCVLHMDISSLDFNQVVRICREHGLYGALVYIFNKGLDDFRSPLEELLMVLRRGERQRSTAIGYRMLVYLKYCFLGLAFPPGHGSLPPTRLPSLRTELIQFLLENSNAYEPNTASALMSRGVYLNLYHLLELDTEATLDVLSCAFAENGILKHGISQLESGEVGLKSDAEDSMHEPGYKDTLVQSLIDALVCILDGLDWHDESADQQDTESDESWPSREDTRHLFEFVAYYAAHCKATIPKTVLAQVLCYLTSEAYLPNSNVPPKKREKQLLNLLKVVPETDWDKTYALHLCEKAQFYQVCGYIHTIKQQYLAALDSYMKDADEPIYAFCHIDRMLLQLQGSDFTAFRSAIIHMIPKLLELNREGTFVLIMDNLADEISHILSELHSHPRSLFLYLKTVIEAHLYGTIDFSILKKTENETADVSDGRNTRDISKELEIYLERVSEFPRFIRNNPVNVTDDMIELYLELLCKYERNSVLRFLETFDSYRVEHCLRLCQEYGIIDAAAFLLERVGDAASALSLTFSGLQEKFVMLENVVGHVTTTLDKSELVSSEQFNSVLDLKEVHEIHDILQACIGLCQRNTPRLNPEESETLWFRLVDTFCEPLMDSYRDQLNFDGTRSPVVVESLGFHDDGGAHSIKWKIPSSHSGTLILRKLFSQFIKEIVEGMIGFIPLPTIMSKLLSENGNQEFGDFKLTILGMLGTYGFERRILDTAKSLIEDDTFYTMSLLKKGASHGYAPRSLLCCICNCPLTKNSSTLRVRVFNCGHATHSQCEQSEIEASSSSLHASSSGCPVCMPKKNTHASRSKSIYPDYGLICTVSSSVRTSQRTSPYSHENDISDNSHGQQISRFEILNKLQKDQRLIQIENMPQLRLAPPAMYHEKVNRVAGFTTGGSSGKDIKAGKPAQSGREKKMKAKSSIFRPRPGREKTSRR